LTIFAFAIATAIITPFSSFISLYFFTIFAGHWRISYAIFIFAFFIISYAISSLSPFRWYFSSFSHYYAISPAAFAFATPLAMSQRRATFSLRHWCRHAITPLLIAIDIIIRPLLLTLPLLSIRDTLSSYLLTYFAFAIDYFIFIDIDAIDINRLLYWFIIERRHCWLIASWQDTGFAIADDTPLRHYAFFAARLRQPPALILFSYCHLISPIAKIRFITPLRFQHS